MTATPVLIDEHAGGHHMPLRSLGWTGRLVASAGRLYPLISGRGRLAMSRLVTWLVPVQPVAVWAQVAGRRCLVPLDDLVGRAAFVFGDLDRKVTWVVEKALGDGDVAVDAGANLGVVSLHMLEAVGSNGRVISIEPSPVVLPFLRATLADDANLPIELKQLALGAQEGTAVLHVPQGNAGKGTLAVSEFAEQTIEHSVPVARLDGLLAGLGVETVALLKIDVEGFEHEVLQGLLDGTCATLPEVIVLEEHAPSQSKAFALLAAHGYKLFGIPFGLFSMKALVPQASTRFTQCHDFVAVHETAQNARRERLGLPRE
ncbi:FkbM family methyltransferase [Roseinatronobacter sp.]